MLALYSIKPGAGEGKSDMLRTSEKDSTFSVAVHALALGAFINLFVAGVES